jgi:hypothetical protein
MPKVVFDSWLLDIRLAWKVFVNIPFHKHKTKEIIREKLHYQGD